MEADIKCAECGKATRRKDTTLDREYTYRTIGQPLTDEFYKPSQDEKVFI